MSPQPVDPEPIPDTTRRDLGRRTLSRLLGAPADGPDPLADVSPDFGRYAFEFSYGDIYNRPSLDARGRQLATICCLMTLGADPQLETHIRIALNVDVDPEEITETLLHCVSYIGFPRVQAALLIARRVFADAGVLPVEPAG